MKEICPSLFFEAWRVVAVMELRIIRVELLMKLHLRATECHLSYEIIQCYLSPDTSEHTHLNPSQTGRYSIYLPRRDGRLS